MEWNMKQYSSLTASIFLNSASSYSNCNSLECSTPHFCQQPLPKAKMHALQNICQGIYELSTCHQIWDTVVMSSLESRKWFEFRSICTHLHMKKYQGAQKPQIHKLIPLIIIMVLLSSAEVNIEHRTGRKQSTVQYRLDGSQNRKGYWKIPSADISFTPSSLSFSVCTSLQVDFSACFVTSSCSPSCGSWTAWNVSSHFIQTWHWTAGHDV